MLRRIQVVSSAPSSRSGYRATTRQWHATLRRLSTAGALAAAVASGGCSFSYQLDNLFAKEGDATQARSLRPTITKRSDEPTADGDLAIARAAVTEVLTKGGKDASMPWENPDTGARGTITPLASAYAQDGTTCRDFLASYVKNGNESWLQGAACRGDRGKWEVRNLRSWKNI
jgi:surface antigen